MIPRRLAPLLRQSLRRFPAVGLVGSRQVGKTTLAKAVAAEATGSLYLDLERPADLARLREPEMYLELHQDELVILDEVQRLPGLFPVLRALIDAHPRHGRFLLLGSASPELLRQSSESLAGRIRYHTLEPLGLDEVPPTRISVSDLWTRGGYPRSVLAASDGASFEWRQAFASTYLERDVPQFGFRIPATTLRRFWQMVAHLHGQLWNASKVAASMDVSAPTAGRYLDMLEDTFLVRRLAPYHANLKKRLVKSPKVYLRDSGLLHALLRIESLDQLLGHPSAGASFEGFVIEQILSTAGEVWEPFFYRTSAGAEIDLVLTRPGRSPIAIEIKSTKAPAVSKGFRSGFEDLECNKGFVVYSGLEQFPLSREVTALPLGKLGVVFGE